MNTTSLPQQLAVFPLPMILLPGGITSLRIFEQRYIRMVKESAGEQGFALSLLEKDQPFSSSTWAAWVEIIDFASLPDGLLNIHVRAKQMVQLQDMQIEADGLRKATVKSLPHWQEPIMDSPATDSLSQALQQVFAENEHISSLYQQPDFTDPNWVCRRWIEILPVSLQNKKIFVQPDSHQQCVEFLSHVLREEISQHE